MTFTPATPLSAQPTSRTATDDESATVDLVGTGPLVRLWPISGAIAAVAGLGAGFFSLGQAMAQEDPDPYLMIETLDRTPYHLAFVLGLVTFAGLLVLVSGLRGWAEITGGGRLAARVVPNALMVTATLVLLAACAAGSLTLYLPGGADDGTMWTEGLFHSYMMLDFGVLLGWWGAVVAACAAVTLAFGPRRILPRWLGIVSIAIMVMPVAAALATGLPGLVGMFMPLWLLVFSVALARQR